MNQPVEFSIEFFFFTPQLYNPPPKKHVLFHYNVKKQNAIFVY